MQPYIFPYIGYFQLINLVDKFVIYDDVNFINRGWINRNNILVNGSAFLFTFSLKNASQNRLIHEIDLVESENNKNKFLKTIELSYRKAIHFNEIFNLVQDLIKGETRNISHLAYLSLRLVADYLEIPTEFVDTSSIYKNSNLKGQHRIIDICEKMNADHYINPIGGSDIYSKELFEKAGIKLNFLKTKAINYKQYDNAFVPNLSIIDVLMFNSKEQIKEMLNSFDLV
jgi:WbqC-like protein family